MPISKSFCVCKVHTAQHLKTTHLMNSHELHMHEQKHMSIMCKNNQSHCHLYFIRWPVHLSSSFICMVCLKPFFSSCSISFDKTILLALIDLNKSK